MTTTGEWLLLDPSDALIGGMSIAGGTLRASSSTFEGYEPFGPQTDCGAFETFDSRVRFPGATWFAADADVNVDHSVYDVGAEAAAIHDAADRIAVECPSMRWLEGGEALNRTLSMELPAGWVGFAQTDIGSDYSLWFAVGTRENLLSVVRVLVRDVAPEPGTAPPSDEANETLFLSAVLEADERLAGAKASQPIPELAQRPTTTTSVPVPTTTVTSPPVVAVDPEAVGVFDVLMFDGSDFDIDLDFEEETLAISSDEFVDCKGSEAFSSFFGSLEHATVGQSGIEDFDGEASLVIEAVGVSESIDEATWAVLGATELIDCALDLEEGESATFRRLDSLPEGIAVGSAITVRDGEFDGELLFLVADNGVAAYLGSIGSSDISAEYLVELFASKLSAFESRVRDCHRLADSAETSSDGTTSRCVGYDLFPAA